MPWTCCTPALAGLLCSADDEPNSHIDRSALCKRRRDKASAMSIFPVSLGQSQPCSFFLLKPKSTFADMIYDISSVYDRAGDSQWSPQVRGICRWEHIFTRVLCVVLSLLSPARHTTHPFNLTCLSDDDHIGKSHEQQYTTNRTH